MEQAISQGLVTSKKVQAPRPVFPRFRDGVAAHPTRLRRLYDTD
jgi:hypothetical protein